MWTFTCRCRLHFDTILLEHGKCMEVLPLSRNALIHRVSPHCSPGRVSSHQGSSWLQQPAPPTAKFNHPLHHALSTNVWLANFEEVKFLCFSWVKLAAQKKNPWIYSFVHAHSAHCEFINPWKLINKTISIIARNFKPSKLQYKLWTHHQIPVLAHRDS